MSAAPDMSGELGRALDQLRAGGMVVVCDDPDRENEGDLCMAAELVTAEAIAFMACNARGLICLSLPAERCDELALPLMVPQNEGTDHTAFTVSIEAATGVTTGISAADRARTIRVAVDPASRSGDLVRPGHVFPLRARPGGVLEREGHTEAGPDLCRLAGLRPAAAICEIANDDGTMARLPELVVFARRHGLALVSIEDLIAYRRRVEASVTRAATTSLPTEHGSFTALGYRSEPDGVEHIALVAGGLSADGTLPDGDDVLVRVHSECLTGDVFGSLRCDCGPQLAASLERIASEGRGVVLYLRGHEGRGIGLVRKLRAYELQEGGRDTVDANLELGLPADARDYRAAALILQDLGVRSVRLLSNNPDKHEALTDHGLKVRGREAVRADVGEHNLRYLLTKRDRMGHDLPWLDELSPVHSA